MSAAKPTVGLLIMLLAEDGKIDLEKSSQLFDYQLHPFVLRLAPDETSQFVREWHSHFMGPEKHYGYAVQWFSLAIALLGIYLVVNTHRKQK